MMALQTKSLIHASALKQIPVHSCGSSDYGHHGSVSSAHDLAPANPRGAGSCAFPKHSTDGITASVKPTLCDPLKGGTPHNSCSQIQYPKLCSEEDSTQKRTMRGMLTYTEQRFLCAQVEHWSVTEKHGINSQKRMYIHEQRRTGIAQT